MSSKFTILKILGQGDEKGVEEGIPEGDDLDDQFEANLAAEQFWTSLPHDGAQLPSISTGKPSRNAAEIFAAIGYGPMTLSPPPPPHQQFWSSPLLHHRPLFPPPKYSPLIFPSPFLFLRPPPLPFHPIANIPTRSSSPFEQAVHPHCWLLEDRNNRSSQESTFSIEQQVDPVVVVGDGKGLSRQNGTNTCKRAGHPYQSRQAPSQKKPRTSFTKAQVSILERRFVEQKYLASAERGQLAAQLQMEDGQVKTWFQNRRTKWRRQEAEDREFDRGKMPPLLVPKTPTNLNPFHP